MIKENIILKQFRFYFQSMRNASNSVQYTINYFAEYWAVFYYYVKLNQNYLLNY